MKFFSINIFENFSIGKQNRILQLSFATESEKNLAPNALIYIVCTLYIVHLLLNPVNLRRHNKIIRQMLYNTPIQDIRIFPGYKFLYLEVDRDPSSIYTLLWVRNLFGKTIIFQCARRNHLEFYFPHMMRENCHFFY